MTDQEKHEAQQVELIARALKDVFGDPKNLTGEGKRFVDVSRIPLLCATVINTNKAITEINKKLDEKYVTKEAFGPVKSIVYGLVGLILTAVVVALVGLVIIK